MSYRWTLEDLQRRQRERAIGNIVSITPVRPAALPAGPPERAGISSVTIPWPPSGNTAVRHARNGVHYLRSEVREYRRRVRGLLAGVAPVVGQYELHLMLSPPDKRRRDADNAIKSALDALVSGGYLPDDRMEYMRELHIVVDGYRGEIAVRALGAGPRAA